MPDFSRELISLLGKENVLADPASLLACSAAANFDISPQTEILPLAIARPVRTDQLALLLRHCSEANVPLAIRGSATTPCANTQPVVEGTVILELTGLNRILEIDRENRVAHVQAGATWQALQEAAASQGLFFPVNALPVSTMGGNIAMNAAGGSSFKYGAIGAWLEELEVYSTSGERIVCGSQTSQLLAGFPLAPLFCGSAGCLGVIATARLRLLPLPEATKNLLFSFSTPELAAEAFCRILTLPVVPASLEFYDSECAALLGFDTDSATCLLACAFQGSAAEVKSALALARAKVQAGREEKAMPATDLLPALARGGRRFALEILQAPPSRFSRLLEGIDLICQKHAMKSAVFGSPFRLHVALFINGNREALAAGRHDLFVFELMLNEKMASETEAELKREEWQQQQELARLSEKLRPLFDPQGLLAAHPLPGARAAL